MTVTNMRAFAARRMAAGLCVRCGRPNPKATWRCPDCVEVTSEVVRLSRQARNACARCGRPKPCDCHKGKKR